MLTAPTSMSGVAAAAVAQDISSSLQAMLHARSVAVIGATDRAGSVGAAVMANVVESGFRGDILPVNPNRASVMGRKSLRRIGDAPSPIDLAVVCTPAPTIPDIVRQCGDAGVRGLVVLSAGFRECGAEGAVLERRVRAELYRFPAMRVIGPNCVGLIVPGMGLNASFARGGACPGGVALLSQSGALCTALLGWARDEGIGFSHFVSVGNMLDVGFGDLLDYLADDQETTSVVLYVEAITDAERFLAAAKRCTARKPVIAYKAGCNRASARAAASHTGAMAGEDAVYDAAFEEVGIIRVRRLDDLLGTAELLGRRRWPAGPRLAIVTNAGGPGVIATDALVSGKGELAQLSNATTGALNCILPPHWSHANPVDVIGDAPPERLAAAVEAVLGDPGVDGVAVVVTPQAMIDTTHAARAVTRVASTSSKPILAVWMGGAMVREGSDVLQSAGIPTYPTPEQAVEAFLNLAAHARHVASCGEAGSRASPAAREGETPARDEVESILQGRCGILCEPEAKRLLSLYGLRVVETRTARTRDEAVAAARELGFPVVLKVHSPDITHKTDAGGVRLDLRTPDDAASAFDDIRCAVAAHNPRARIEGVTVEPMLDRSRGVELLVGGKRDATFGPVVLVGAGGTTVEVLDDRALGLAPISAEGAARMLAQLRIAPLLGAFRGRPALNLKSAAKAIVSISRLMAENPSVTEADANPVLVTPEDVIVLDARVVMASDQAVPS